MLVNTFLPKKHAFWEVKLVFITYLINKAMYKNTAILVFILFLVTGINAQQLKLKSNNPFSSLQFINSPTDTISLIADFVNVFNKINDKNMDMIAFIAKNGGVIAKKLNYAIEFTIAGYPQRFYAPCKDDNLLKSLSSNPNSVTKLKLSCVVYRFYYITNTYNFFYIDKADVKIELIMLYFFDDLANGLYTNAMLIQRFNSLSVFNTSAST